jgi:hypothetical protein
VIKPTHREFGQAMTQLVKTAETASPPLSRACHAIPPNVPLSRQFAKNLLSNTIARLSLNHEDV